MSKNDMPIRLFNYNFTEAFTGFSLLGESFCFISFSLDFTQAFVVYSPYSGSSATSVPLPLPNGTSLLGSKPFIVSHGPSFRIYASVLNSVLVISQGHLVGQLPRPYLIRLSLSGDGSTLFVLLETEMLAFNMDSFSPLWTAVVQLPVRYVSCPTIFAYMVMITPASDSQPLVTLDPATGKQL